MTRLTIVQGDTVVLRIAIKNSDDTPADLDGFEITFTLKRSKQDSDAAAIFQGTLANGDIVIVANGPSPFDGDDGVIDVTLPAENSNQVRSGRKYFWDVQLTDVDENTYTPCIGTLYSDAEVTQTAA